MGTTESGATAPETRRSGQYAPAVLDPKGPVPLWPSELLADPGLGLELVAGRAGLDRRGPIRWAHIADTPDPTPWLEGGELLLTTGLGVKDSPSLQQRLIAGLAGRGVVAVGFGTGVSLEEVPATMVAACDSAALPLFTVPYEVPFLAVTRRVSRAVFEEHFATLRSAVTLHRQVLAAVVADHGLRGVLATVGRAMPTTALLAFDFAGAELARHDPDGRLDGLAPELLWKAAAAEGPAATLPDGQLVTSATVRIGQELEAVVAVVTAESLIEHQTLLFEQGVAGVSLERARRRSVREAQRARVDELLEEVAAGRDTPGLVARALRRLGVPPPAAYRVLAVARPDGVGDAQLAAVVEDALLPFGRPVVGRLAETWFALVPVPADTDAGGHDARAHDHDGRDTDDGPTGGDHPDAATRIVEALRARGWPRPRVGRSRVKTGAEALRAAIREASVALRVDDGTAVHDVDQLGLSGLLAGIRDDLGATDFVTSVLGPVLDHDAREATRLVDTLRAYLAHGCRPGPAAAELCVHRHTLTYRLDRIRELTGRDPRGGDHLLEYGLALELHARTTAREPT